MPSFSGFCYVDSNSSNISAAIDLYGNNIKSIDFEGNYSDGVHNFHMHIYDDTGGCFDIYSVSNAQFLAYTMGKEYCSFSDIDSWGQVMKITDSAVWYSNVNKWVTDKAEPIYAIYFDKTSGHLFEDDETSIGDSTIYLYSSADFTIPYGWKMVPELDEYDGQYYDIQYPCSMDMTLASFENDKAYTGTYDSGTWGSITPVGSVYTTGDIIHNPEYKDLAFMSIAKAKDPNKTRYKKDNSTIVEADAFTKTKSGTIVQATNCRYKKDNSTIV